MQQESSGYLLKVVKEAPKEPYKYSLPILDERRKPFTPAGRPLMGSSDAAKSDIEREKLAFEMTKWDQSLALEREKIALERRNALLSRVSIIIPLLVVAVTIYANTLDQRHAAQDAFELKVAEAVLEAKSVTESSNRADGLAAFFPERLPRDFAKRLEPLKTKLQRGEMDRRALLTMLVNSPRERRQEVLELWLLFYPADRQLLPESLRVETR